VLLDLGLPDSQGLEAVTQISRERPALPVIVLTGRDDDAVARAALTVGAQDYLVKGTIEPGILLRAIRYAYERKRVDETLRTVNVELERKVGERTAELRDTVERLQSEVTQRQQAEADLRHVNRVLRMLSACNEAVLRSEDEHQLMQEICRIAVTIGGYRMAWVGLAEDDAAQSIRPVASIGFEDGYLELARISWADTERGRGPTGTAVRLGQVQIGRDFLSEPRLAPWRAEALRRGFRSSVALPLHQGEAVIGALTIYAAAPDAFRDAEIQLLRELAEDLDFGITAVRMRMDLRESRDQLRALAAQLTLAEQRERRRVAEVLHDSVQQLLVGARLQVLASAPESAGAARRAAQEVAELLSQALAVTRSLMYELRPPMLYEGGFLPAVEWLVRWMRDTHGLTVTLTTAGAVPVEAEEARILLFQALRELLFNVVKHAKVPTARVRIERRGAGLCFAVEDDGVGFDPEQVRANGGGTGLLGIRERLERLGGRLEIDSAPGKGARFTLWAPLQGPRPVPPPLAGPSQLPPGLDRPVSPAEREARKIRVLVVEDHLVVRQGLVRLLQEEPDIEVVAEAADGATAIALTSQLLPAVVTMDINLPGMDGIEATQRIRAACPTVQVIGLSVHEDSAQAVAMREAGAVAYLAKSSPAQELVAAIRASLERK